MRRILAQCAGRRRAVWQWTSASSTFCRMRERMDVCSRQSGGAIPVCSSSRRLRKLYGMAGVRLGYGLCADEDLLDANARALGQPWAVSSLAQTAGLAALEANGICRAALRTTDRDGATASIRRGCGRWGCRVIPKAGRTICCFTARMNTLGERLEKLGVVVRSCGNYHGAGTAAGIGTAVRTQRENDSASGGAAGGDGMMQSEADHGAGDDVRRGQEPAL